MNEAHRESGFRPSASLADHDRSRRGDAVERPPAVTEATPQMRAEARQIEEVVAALERAQLAEDVEAFLSVFAPNPVWVTAHGKSLTGLDEIAEFTRRVLPGAMRDSTSRYEVRRIAFVRPDVAIVSVNQGPVTHDGEPLRDIPEGRPMYVVAKQDGRWLIVAAQNTHVREG